MSVQVVVRRTCISPQRTGSLRASTGIPSSISHRNNTFIPDFAPSKAASGQFLFYILHVGRDAQNTPRSSLPMPT